MSTIQIADKPTLDSVKSNTDTQLTRGGIKYNSTTSKYQTYNTTNSTWVDTEFGGGGSSPTIIIPNKYATAGDMNNLDITVTQEDTGWTTTVNMGTNESITVEVPWCDVYQVSFTLNGVVKSNNVDVTGIGGVVWETLVIEPFSTATDAEIEAMLESHYNGKIDLSTIWSVGDTRTLSLSAMSATGVGESHVAQNVTMAIIDFDHDDLTTAISGVAKAAVTLQQVDSLNEQGYMNSSSTNVGGWTSSARRTWCNEVYYNALPSTFKSLVKSVNKNTSAGNKSSTINTDSDKVWLLAEYEVFGSNTQSQSGEGTQYPYYETTSNRIKKRNGSAGYWWLRSPRGSDSTRFDTVKSDGGVYYSAAADTRDLAPALCI